MAVAWTEAVCPEAVRWYVAALGAATLDEGSFSRVATSFRLGADALRVALMQRREVFGGFEPRHVELGQDGLFVLTGIDAKGRPCTARIRVDQDRPYSIRSHAIFVTPAPGYTIREGTSADFAACADVEGRTPIVSTEGSYLLSRGEDIESYLELQRARLWVIECKSEIVGWTAAALRTLQSRQFTLGYAAQAFLLPEHRASKAFMPASAHLNAWLQENADGMFYYMNVGNESSSNFNRGREYWNAVVCDFQIPVRNGRHGADRARTERANLSRAADLINAAHSGEALFDPYTADTIVERFSRSRRAYDTDRLLMSPNAVIGVARGREKIAHTSKAGLTTHSIVASVLDYGFDAGHGATEFRELIATAAASANSEGCTHLSILSTPNAPAHDILASMAENVDHYLMGSSLQSPRGVEATGLYADHIYF